MNKSEHQTNQSPQNYKIFGLVGTNLRPLSAAMHNAAFKALDLPYVYKNFDMLNISEAIQLMRVTEITGLSVTIPYKEEVMGLIDALSPEAERAQAVNTVVKIKQKLIGYNTDIYGFAEALPQRDFKQCLILGAGGAAKAVLTALTDMSIRQVIVATRNPIRAISLQNLTGAKIISLDDLSSLNDIDLLVNTTPLDNNLIEGFSFTSILTRDATVFDINPGDTNFTAFANTQGYKCIRGEAMLLAQAKAQFELFTGLNSPSYEMEQALANVL